MASTHTGRPRQVFVGSIVSPITPRQLRTIQHGVLGVDSKGIIAFVVDLDEIKQQAHGEDGASTPVARRVRGVSGPHSQALNACLTAHGWSAAHCEITVLPYGDFLCPGFIDTHTHACQVPNMGAGQEYELLDWLNNVTFPREKRFEDAVYAEKTYNSVVQRLLDCGTTTACYYATIHLEASKTLARICAERGQRAFVGKCNLNRNAPTDYCEDSVASSVKDTESFLTFCQDLYKHAGGDDRKMRCVPANPPALRPHSSSISSVESHGSTSSFSFSSSPSYSQADSASPSPATSFSSTSVLDDGLPVTEISYNTTSSVPHEDDKDDKELMQHSMSKLSRTVDEMIEKSELQPNRTAESLDSAGGALVQPILTPRFAISCTDELLSEISKIFAREPGLRLQTHLSESTGEIEYTKQLFPFAGDYTRVYDHFKLLTDRTILAHCVHLSKEELQLVKARDSGISHCPTSNMNLRSGVTRVGEMLNAGVKVGLGTDVSGGFGVSMLSAIREASVVAKVLNFTQKEIDIAAGNSGTCADVTPADADADTSSDYDYTKRPLAISTLFYLATLGGARVASVDDRTGSLQVGKEFDALRVSLCPRSGLDEDEQASTGGDGLSNAYEGNPNVFVHTQEEHDEVETLDALVEKFLFTADDRNIGAVWVRGRLVGGTQLRKARSGPTKR